MYEDNHIHAFRRMALIGLWLLAVLVVAGLLVWLIFFHHDSKGVIKTGEKSGSGHTQTSQPSASTPATIPKPATTSTPTVLTPDTTPTSASPSTTTPSQLANTGPGDLATPILGAVLVGSAVYYVRLHRKLVS